MRYGFRRILRRSPCLLVAFGLLVLAFSGCGDSTADEDVGGIPATLKKSNDNMENFMKSQNAAKTKKKS